MQRHKIKARKASTHSGNQPAAAILRQLARQHIRVSLTVHKAQTLLTIEAHPSLPNSAPSWAASLSNMRVKSSRCCKLWKLPTRSILPLCWRTWARTTSQ